MKREPHDHGFLWFHPLERCSAEQLLGGSPSLRCAGADWHTACDRCAGAWPAAVLDASRRPHRSRARATPRHRGRRPTRTVVRGSSAERGHSSAAAVVRISMLARIARVVGEVLGALLGSSGGWRLDLAREGGVFARTASWSSMLSVTLVRPSSRSPYCHGVREMKAPKLALGERPRSGGPASPGAPATSASFAGVETPSLR